MLKLLSFIIDNFQVMIVIIFSSILIVGWVELFLRKTYRIPNYNILSKFENMKIDKMIEEVKVMEGREFEEFCFWMFNNTGKYTSVELTPAYNDEGKDLILKDSENDLIYVECKRYTEKASVTEDFMIGREICQKLVGAMISDNIKKAIIITTGNIHQNAWDYIYKLEKNTHIKIDIITMEDIKQILENISIKKSGISFNGGAF